MPSQMFLFSKTKTNFSFILLLVCLFPRSQDQCWAICCGFSSTLMASVPALSSSSFSSLATAWASSCLPGFLSCHLGPLVPCTNSWTDNANCLLHLGIRIKDMTAMNKWDLRFEFLTGILSRIPTWRERKGHLREKEDLATGSDPEDVRSCETKRWRKLQRNKTWTRLTTKQDNKSNDKMQSNTLLSVDMLMWRGNLTKPQV